MPRKLTGEEHIFHIFKIERGAENLLFDGLLDSPQLELHGCGHRLIRVRSKASQNAVTPHKIRKTRYNFLPARPECPTPTAQGGMEIVKRQRHR